MWLNATKLSCCRGSPGRDVNGGFFLGFLGVIVWGLLHLSEVCRFLATTQSAAFEMFVIGFGV